MNFAVLHFEKGAGNDAPISSHIERTVSPTNADKERTYLNRELVEFPDGVKNRTEAIQHRIETAGITRKISHHQVRAIRVILSGSHEGMQDIQNTGKLDEWCRDSLEWLQREVGKENVVSAVLHLDEKTPHIHATVVPIVTGERRKAKTEKPVAGKKQYKKKSPTTARLCADDIMARDKFKHFQDTYAETMSKFGLARGRNGSEARHITTQQYYRDLADKNEKIREDNEVLEEQKAEAGHELSRIKSGIKIEQLKSSVVDMATSAVEGIGSVFGSSKVKRQQLEIEELKSANAGLQTENTALKEQIQTDEHEHAKITDKFRQELNKIHTLFPKIKELLRIETLCRHIGFSENLTKAILEMKPVEFKGKLYSSEYGRYFETPHSVAEIKPSANAPNKLKLTIDDVSDVNWFRRKHREDLQKMEIKIEQEPRIDKNKKITM